MRLKNILTIALLATAGIGLTHPTAQAAAVTYQNGDLLLGFRASSGDGAQLNYVVNIGQASTYRDATSSFVIPLTGLNTDLDAMFVNDTWKTRGDVFWSISGTTGSFAPVAGDPAKTLYATRAQAFSGGNFTPAAAWLSKSDTAQGLAASQLKSFKDGFIAKAGVPNQSTANTPNGIIQNTSDSNSYASFTSSGSSFGFFNPSVEGNFGNGQNASRLDLFSVKPADGVTVMLDEPGTLLGTFVLYASGNLAFVLPGDPLPPDIEGVLPVVNLAALPKAGTKFSAPNNVQTFSGTLVEANLDTFAYSINGAASVPIEAPELVESTPGNYTWTVPITLVSGVNNIAFTAIDLSGNTRTLSRSVSYVKPISTPTDLIEQSPNGTIALPKGAINEGFAYKLTAKPAAGFIVQQWFKDGAPLGVGGNSLTINPTEGDEYSAVFIPNFFPAVVGAYPGIFGNGDVSGSSLATFNLENGSANFTTTATGAFSGIINVGGKAIKVNGQFDGLKNANIVTAAVNLALVIDTTSGVEKITGTLTYNGGAPLAIESFRAKPYTGKVGSIAPLNGKRYSVALQRSVVDTNTGHGFASVAISSKGVATVSGQLPDSTAFSVTVPVVEKGSDIYRIPFSRQLAKGNTGLLHGELEIDAAAQTIESTIDFGWMRAGVANLALPFASGILKNLDGLGSEWTLTKQTLANTSLLTGDAKLALFSLKVDKDNALTLVNPAATYYGYWPSTNKPGINALPAGTTFSFVPATGAFNGKTPKLVGSKNAAINYRGLALPDAALIAPAPALHGVGYITTGSFSGKVELGETIIPTP